MGPSDEDAIVRDLAARYPGAVSTRGLWQWAGGDRHQVAYLPDPTDEWSSLWTLAREGTSATPIALLREALFDHPGDEDLLGYLAGEFRVRDDARQPRGLDLAALLPGLAAPDAAEARLAAWLLLVPPHDTEQSLAYLAPALQHVATLDERLILEARLETVAGREPWPLGVLLAQGLRELLLPWRTARGLEPEQRQALRDLDRGLAPLAPHLDPVPRPPDGEPEPSPAERVTLARSAVEEHFEPVVAAVATHAGPDCRLLFDLQRERLTAAELLAPQSLPEEARLAALHGLWATAPAPDRPVHTESAEAATTP